MPTARLLTVARSIPGGGLHRMCVCPGGVCPERVCVRGGFQGLCRGGGVCPSKQWGRPLPRVNRMTDRCKNITLPQTLFAGGNNVEPMGFTRSAKHGYLRKGDRPIVLFALMG